MPDRKETLPRSALWCLSLHCEPAMNIINWQDFSVDKKKACTAYKLSLDYGAQFRHVWAVQGELEEQWNGDGSGATGILGMLLRLRDDDGNRKRIYGTTNISDRRKYPQLNLSIVLAGSSEEITLAYPVIVIKHPDAESRKYAENFKALIEDHNICQYGFAVVTALRVIKLRAFSLAPRPESADERYLKTFDDYAHSSRSLCGELICMTTNQVAVNDLNRATCGGILHLGKAGVFGVTTSHAFFTNTNPHRVGTIGLNDDGDRTLGVYTWGTLDTGSNLHPSEFWDPSASRMRFIGIVDSAEEHGHADVLYTLGSLEIL